jgi:hypothetical protein
LSKLALKTRDMPAGRPTKYEPEYNFQVEKLAKLGATDKEIADFLDVNEDTIHEWKKVYPEFSESIKKGKLIADSNVAQSLYHRAIGYDHEDTDIRVVDKEIVQTPIIKYYPPDPTAAIFWLKNRRSREWRDKQEVEQKHSGGISINWSDPKLRHTDDQSSPGELQGI